MHTAQRVKHFFVQFGFSILMVVICIYLAMQMLRGVGDVVEVEQTSYTTVQDTLQLDAFLFRDEVPLYGDGGGTNCFLAEDGEHVAVGAQVVISYAQATDASVQEQITRIDRMIRILEQSNLQAGALTTDLSILDRRIADMHLSILREVSDDDLAKALRSEEALWVQMNCRQVQVNPENNAYAERIRSLQQERAGLERSLTGLSYRVNAPETGYFYSAADGYETVFTPALLEGLTVQGFAQLSQFTPDQKILQSACGKLVRNATWYVAVQVDKRTAGKYREGSNYDMLFPYSGGKQLSMQLYRRIMQTDLDDAVLVFRCDVLPDGFDFSRSQTVQLVVGTYAGIRLDADALRVLDGELGCYVLDGTKVIFKKADILYRNEEYAVCRVPYNSVKENREDRAYISETEISLYDTVILSGSDLYVGKVLQ